MKARVLILHAPGTNRDREAAWACAQAGGDPEIVTTRALLQDQRRLLDYAMLLLPGGFSFGDDLGAGQVWGLTLRQRLGEDLETFVRAGRPVLGICNGFQALVRSGLLPGDPDGGAWSPSRGVTLTRNASARFECRWVTLAPTPKSVCVFTQDLDEPIACPSAHGEGRLYARDEADLDALEARGQVALRYVAPDLTPAAYPHNPNGSMRDIAGLCNPAGNVLGLMPHPEDHISPEQHPLFGQGWRGRSGLALFRAGLRHASRVGGA